MAADVGTPGGPRMSRSPPSRWPRRLRLPAGHPALGPLLAGALALALAVGAARLSGMPVPRVHDEFSYLLAADTFAQGRLTNPTHPYWRHFETLYVLHRPTYQSMYPPAQGLALAAGQRLGHPILGVWLSVAAMAAALAWMLRGWLPAPWAWLGALLAVGQYVILGREYGNGVVGYWSQSYWGGAVAATGGALVYGALPRLLRGRRVRDGLLFGLGLAVLANSRPYEGFVTALPACLVLGIHVLRRRIPGGTVLALALTVAVSAAAMGFYNQCVTGDPTKMPYIEHHEQYCTYFPIFMFRPPRSAPEWNHEILRYHHTVCKERLLERYGTPGGVLVQSLLKLKRLWLFFIGPLLTIPLLFLPLRRVHGPALAACGLAMAACLLCERSSPHYFAPTTAPLLVLIAVGMRRLWHMRIRARPAGAWIGAAVFVGLWAQTLAALPLPGRDCTAVSRFMGYRQELERDLARIGGKHLVFVRYGPRHSVDNEWVYNAADIDASPVVWAHAMREEEDAALRTHFRDRTAWRLEIDEDARRPVLRPDTAPVP
jgi:hypothetical protein